ncbi:MAG TPA: UDP-N-acetylmuramoyl-tripeptide--D-alanyl-D-alanine ligase [Candidatus Kapabacteria bacterium]|nr:UDP-N-acetylmuramoyl-tripeptide--D-alanyl-D-alanine ligase [Candidatus Kapabacteria bacterium]
MLKNKVKFSGVELAAIFGNNSLQNINLDMETIGVSIDTRDIEQGNIFIALVGENLDAHSKLQEAFDKGATLAIVNKNWYKKNIDIAKDLHLIIVKDTLNAFQRLAQFHRYRFNGNIIAVAGSNGKTTTKEMIASVLSKKYKILKTYKNYNNQIGVPQMLLQLNDDIDFAIIEIGTNYPGEIMILSEMIAPTAGIITNIGKEHLEGFIDLDGVELEETTLLGYLKKTEGMFFLNNDDQRLREYFWILDSKFTFGSTGEFKSNLNAKIDFDDELHPIIDFSNEEIDFTAKLQCQGLNFAYNAIAAASVGVHYNVPISDIQDALENFQPDNSESYGRGIVEKIGDVLLINDTYNANPDSMNLALQTLQKYNHATQKIAVLGDMLEQGDASIDEHINVLKKASEIANSIYIFGKEFKQASDKLNNLKIRHFENKDDLFENLKSEISSNTAVLVKGSRGMKMEEITEKIKKYLQH